MKFPKGKAAYHYIHGYCLDKSKTGVYAVWSTMRQRCNNPKHHKYPSYGGRGIRVCERWNKFQNFLADMGDRPSKDHSIGRIDNDADYTPENCRWETRIEQGRNKRNNHFLEFNGKRATLAEWSRITGIAYVNLKNRIRNLGWSVERTLTEPVNHLWPRV